MPVVIAEGALDSGLVTEAVNLVKTVMGLFGEYPLNLILVFSLAGGAFALFKRAKRAAK